jgi:hypothetical protein
MADPRRMTPEEHGEAHALLVRAVTDPDWQAASQALDDLMAKLLVMRGLLEAEERLPTRKPAPSRNVGAIAGALSCVDGQVLPQALPVVRCMACRLPGFGHRPGRPGCTLEQPGPGYDPGARTPPGS